jgi:putative tryptophan/tyrosine transport system substrate-binding protein
MARKTVVVLLVGLTFVSVYLAEAQQPKKVPRIVYLDAVSLSAHASRIEAFRQGLRELGYVEGRNIVVEYRHADGKYDRLPALVAELVRLKVDVIVTAGATVTHAAKEATTTIPIVMAQDPNDIEIAFRSAMKGRADAVLVLTSAFTDSYQTEIAKLALKSRLPVIYARAEAVDAGGACKLWREHCRFVPTRRYVCGQDFEGRKAS